MRTYGNEKKVLLVAHEFSRTGAPRAILYLARALFHLSGFHPTVIAAVDGPIRQEFEDDGFSTVVEPLLFEASPELLKVTRFVAGFERVIVTPLASFAFIRNFKNVPKYLVWWIHEEENGFNYIVENFAPDLAEIFNSCDAVWLGSPLCNLPTSRYAASEKLHLLLYGCDDIAPSYEKSRSEPITFTLVGSIEPRKGQDIFLDAIEKLPAEIRQRARFQIIGSPYNDWSAAFHEKISAQARKFSEVECIPNVPFEELSRLYTEADVVVSTSRADPMPISITQGLMFSKTCLYSSAIGHAGLLTDGIDGVIFPSESAGQLAEKISWLIQNPGKLAAIGTAGRKVYEKHFLMASFIANVDKLFHDRPLLKKRYRKFMAVDFRILTSVTCAIVIASSAVVMVRRSETPASLVEVIASQGAATTERSPSGLQFQVSSSGLTLSVPGCDAAKFPDKFFLHLYTESSLKKTPANFVNFDFFLAQDKGKESVSNGVKTCFYHKNYNDFSVKELTFGQFTAPNNQCCNIIWSRSFIFNKTLPGSQ